MPNGSRLLSSFEAFEQLREYLNFIASKKHTDSTLYGAVAIGIYVRFYQMEEGDTQPYDLFGRADKQPYGQKSRGENS
ncbi:hypothetical protein N7478_007023 [Penicillium angulare]|uniref:uncharacterized protein n=1 Tax=Penicillium angulare TaxID=116970 RepID=UPI002540A213|nr:uncharacterized protein N7478_007023 [Penicillium angulare]KAJ5281651.1 hypothetical protein N7478_007023 [Penicillium angulare]